MAETHNQEAPEKPKKKIGRPSKYTPELAAEICERLSNGEPLRQICRDDHMPAWQKIYEWMARDPQLSGAIAQARDLGGDAIAEDCMRIMEEPPDYIVSENSQRVDPGYVQWQKNRVELRLKLLAKWNPKKYGDRIVHAGDADNPVEIKTNAEIFESLLSHLQLKRQSEA